MEPVERATSQLCLAFSILLAISACSSSSSPTAPTGGGGSQPPATTTTPIRVLMLTATAGFRHDSIATAQQVMERLASSGEFTVT
jgi:hypothetical protein